MFEFIESIPSEYLEIAKIFAIIFFAVIADRLISRRLKTIAKILHVRVETVKGLQFFFRFIIIAVALVLLAGVRWFPSEYFVGAGAILGTIIGFASASAISNFLSGASVLVSRVIRIGDYVKIDDIEGVVVDMSINYTKIRRVDGSFVFLSNKDISSKKIQNYRIEKDEEEYYVYPIKFALDRSISLERVMKAVDRIREEIKDRIRNLRMIVESVSRLEIQYILSLEVDRAEDIIELKPIILTEIAAEFGG